jgi:hypothetical protein
MKSGVVAALLVVAILVGAGAGYLFGNVNERTVTSFFTVSTTTITLVTTTTTTVMLGTCSPIGGIPPFPLPVGFHVTVSYEGNWSVAIATFAAKTVNGSGFVSACESLGNGTTTFYVGLANYTGWNSVLAMAHKFGSNGTLTVDAAIGNETSSNSTTQPYGSAITILSFDEAGQ